MGAELTAVLNKMIEFGDLLRLNHVGEEMTESRLQQLVDEQVKGAALVTAVLAYAPRVQPGEMADAYGVRLLAEVRRRRGAGSGGR